MPRLLPESSPRVETGAVQFGEDWPGVFIRGDQALYYLAMLRAFLATRLPPGAEDVRPDGMPTVDWIELLVVQDLQALLDSCIVGHPEKKTPDSDFWNHRVVRRVYEHEGRTEETYAIHEAHYEGGTPVDGQPILLSTEPDGVVSESLSGLRWTLVRMLDALGRPVVEWSSVVKHREEEAG